MWSFTWNALLLSPSSQTLALASKPTSAPSQGGLSSSDPSSHATFSLEFQVRARGPRMSLEPHTFAWQMEEPQPKEELGSALYRPPHLWRDKANMGASRPGLGAESR